MKAYFIAFGFGIFLIIMNEVVEATPATTRLAPGDTRGRPDAYVCICHHHPNCVPGVTRLSELHPNWDYTWFDNTSCEEKKAIHTRNLQRIKEKRSKFFWQ